MKKSVYCMPIWIVKSNVSSVGPSSERNRKYIYTTLSMSQSYDRRALLRVYRELKESSRSLIIARTLFYSYFPATCMYLHGIVIVKLISWQVIKRAYIISVFSKWKGNNTN